MMESNSLYQTLYNKAVQLLAQRNHSSAELKQKLSIFSSKKMIKGPDDSNQIVVDRQIDAVIQYCLSHHWIDDQNYIEQYINMRSRKGYGQNRILFELRQRGLSSVLINNQLNHVNLDWIEIGLTLIQKKYSFSDKKDLKQKVKIYQFLTYRGFQQEDIKQIYSLF